MIAAFGRADGTFAPPTTLDLGALSGRRAPRSLSTPALAANAAGDVIAAWWRDDGNAAVIRVVERRAAGPLQAVRTRSPDDARVPAVAINQRRDRVIAWYRHGFIEARVRRPGHGWGSVLEVARSAHTPTMFRATLDPRGRVMLAWSTIDYQEGATVAAHLRCRRPTAATGLETPGTAALQRPRLPVLRRRAAALGDLRLGGERLRRLARPRRRPARCHGGATGGVRSLHDPRRHQRPTSLRARPTSPPDVASVSPFSGNARPGNLSCARKCARPFACPGQASEPRNRCPSPARRRRSANRSAAAPRSTRPPAG